jgi:hypothetical protein
MRLGLIAVSTFLASMVFTLHPPFLGDLPSSDEAIQPTEEVLKLTGIITAVDRELSAFSIRLRRPLVFANETALITFAKDTPVSRLFFDIEGPSIVYSDTAPARLEELQPGTEVRISLKKTPDNTFSAQRISILNDLL